MNRALGIGGALIGALVIYLFIEVRAEPGTEVDQDSLARAQSEARARDARAEKQSTSRSSTPTPAPVSKPAARVDDSGDGDGDEGARPAVMVTGQSMSIDTDAPTFDESTPFVVKVKEARRLYGRRRYEQAYDLALDLLKEEPKNRRVLRVAVASACIMARPGEAQQHFEQLSYPKDKEQMRRRCRAYGVELPEH